MKGRKIVTVHPPRAIVILSAAKNLFPCLGTRFFTPLRSVQTCTEQSERDDSRRGGELLRKIRSRKTSNSPTIIGLVFIVAFWLCRIGQAQDVKYDLYFDATKVDLLRVAEWLPKNASYLERVFPILFIGGHTAFPTESGLFRENPIYAKKDTFSVLLGVADTMGVEVYPTFDLFHWTLPGADEKEDIFATYPELLELNAEQSCGPLVLGRYASPFHVHVRQNLASLLEEFLSRYRNIGGVCFKVELSFSQMLGYSQAARDASLRAISIDPLLMPALAPEEKGRREKWAQWRLDVITKLLHRLSGISKKEHPAKKVIAISYANAYRWSLWNRSRVGQDWLRWIVDDIVDDVVLAAEWDKEHSAGCYGMASSLITQTGKSIHSKALVALGKSDSKLQSQITALKGQGEAPGLVVYVETERDLKRLSELLGKHK